MMDGVGRTTWTGTAGTDDAPVVASSRAAARRGVAVVLLLTTAVVGGALAGPWDPVLRSEDPVERTPEPSASPPPPPPPDPLAEALREVDVEPWDLSGLALLLAALVLLGLVYLAVRWLRSLPPRRVEVPGDPGDVDPGEITGDAGMLPDLPALREGVEGAGVHLRAQVQPVDAVIAAWVALEEGAAGSGIVRDPASTPTEFTVAVLDRAPVDPTATRTLLGLYLRARFGEEQMTGADVTAATEAVRLLAEGLAAAAEAEDEAAAEVEAAAAAAADGVDDRGDAALGPDTPGPDADPGPDTTPGPDTDPDGAR